MITKLLPVAKYVRGIIKNNILQADKNLYQLAEAQGQSLNVVYILPSNKASKAGGDKVIYKQSEYINQMAYLGVTSQILHPDNQAFKHSWFEHQVDFKLNNQLSAQTDFVVIPEVMVIPHAKMLASLGIRFGIYVQNGYSASIPLYVGSEQDLRDAYHAAEVILTISDDTSECMQLAFPHLADKIQRIYYSVDSGKFKPHAQKENLITYMPRKLARHSDLVRFFLQDNLPAGWRLAAIHGLNETGVVDLLSRSKIFLSFSEFEGCPLPPVEAALSGNMVVGYTGEGAREYWQAPTFTEIYNGDIKHYVKEILQAIQRLESNTQDDQMEQIRQNLASRYSLEAERQSLEAFLGRIANR
jgi:hypothetical protein